MLAVIGAVIPTRFYPHTLQPLLDVLAADDVVVVLQDSSDFDHHLHRMWNNGVRRLANRGCTHVAILNDDIIMKPGTLAFMAAALDQFRRVNVVIPETRLRREQPLPTRIRVAEEPINNGGYAFMFRTHDSIIPDFREDLRIWHGDLAFFDTIRERRGIVGSIQGLWIGHLGSHSVRKIMGSAATDERGGPGLVARLEAAVAAGEESARPLLEDTLLARAEYVEREVPPPGRRWSWEQERRLAARRGSA